MKRAVLFLFLCAFALAQGPSTPSSTPAQQSQPSATTQNSNVARMQLDINNLRSMVNAMGSQINSVQDPATRDALRTNEQMWMLVISDLQLRANQMQRNQSSR